jgi:hypothetical protein
VTLEEAARLGQQALGGAITGFKVVSGLRVSDLPPSNLADIIRDALVHRTFRAGPPSPEMQRILQQARFAPPVFRQVAAPGRIAGQVAPELSGALFDALFHRSSLRPRR